MVSADVHGRVGRYRKTASSWARRASSYIRSVHDEHENPDVRAWLGWEARELITSLLDAAVPLVPLLDPDEADLERAAKDLAVAVRSWRLAAAVARTEGRTPAEAELFRAKAAELRSR